MNRSIKKRKAVLSALQALAGERPTPDMTPYETFNFPLFAIVDGKLSTPERPKEFDAAFVLICATVIEQSLEAAILKKFVPLTRDQERRLLIGESAPLSGIASKIDVAFALGILGPRAVSDLHVIRKIRNTFAHSRLKLTFETEAIAEACGLIALSSDGDDLSPRETFIQAVRSYATRLICYDPNDEPSGVNAHVLDLSTRA